MISTRVHPLKCLAFFTNHLYCVDCPKYKNLLQVTCRINLILTQQTKH